MSVNIKKDISEVEAILLEYGTSDEVIKKITEEYGVETMEEFATLEVSDLLNAGVKLAKARKLSKELKKPQKPSLEGIYEAGIILNQMDVLLPTVPDDETWLNTLKNSGILKVDESSYIAVVRAALAEKVSLYSVPSILIRAMEKYADDTEDQVEISFYALRKSLKYHTYDSVFSTIDGLDESFITDKRRKEFFDRIKETLWPTIAASYESLGSWYKIWQATTPDPTMFFATLSGTLTGAENNVISVAPPDTSMLHDIGDELIDSINRIFRGTGKQLAAMLAYDAKNIRDILNNPQIPMMVGTKNRDLMLKRIGANISSNYVRLEQNLVRYVLSFLKHNLVTSDVEVNYFLALWQLATQIDWIDLGISSDIAITTLNGNRIF